MMSLNDSVKMNIAALLILILFVAGCMGGTALKHESPVHPPEKLPEDIVLDVDNPDFFKIAAKGPILSMTQKDITVSLTYWRNADLNFKYNRGSSVSPFFETEALHQGDKTDVFYVKIENNSPQKVVFKVQGRRARDAGGATAICEIADMRENRFPALSYVDLEQRLRYMRKVGGLYVKNGLRIARQILLERQIPDNEIQPGTSAEGFLPFQELKLNTRELEVIIPLEKAPPEGTAGRYQNVVFRFPLVHSESIRHAQPPTTRY
jgi:hypothetical protein